MVNCFKETTMISVDQDESWIVSAIFDTVAGLNLIWQDVMPIA